MLGWVVACRAYYVGFMHKEPATFPFWIHLALEGSQCHTNILQTKLMSSQLTNLINMKKKYQNCLPKRELNIQVCLLFPLFVCDINNSSLSAFLHIHLFPSKNTRISAFRKLLKWAMMRWVLFLHVSRWFIAKQKQWTFCPSTHQIDAI